MLRVGCVCVPSERLSIYPYTPLQICERTDPTNRNMSTQKHTKQNYCTHTHTKQNCTCTHTQNKTAYEHTHTHTQKTNCTCTHMRAHTHTKQNCTCTHMRAHTHTHKTNRSMVLNECTPRVAAIVFILKLAGRNFCLFLFKTLGTQSRHI